MATQEQASKPKNILGQILISVFLILWVLLCAAAFAYVIRVFGSSTETLQWTTWPFVVLVLGVPALIFLVNGGMVFVDKLMQIEKIISGFDLKTINKLNDLVDQTSGVVGSLSKNQKRLSDDLETIKKISHENSLISQEASSEGDENASEGN